MSSVREIEKLLEDYRNWLRDKTTIKEVEDSWAEITVPFLDRHNDFLQIYAKKDTNGYLLTDDGYTIQDLESSGCNVRTDKRLDLLHTALNGFGVRLDGGSLNVHATAQDFPLKKHNLAQAMLAVNDLFYLAQPVVESLFWEDVIQWLESLNVRFTSGAKFTGVSGYDHLFDFIIPKSKIEPERIVQAVNRPTRDTAESLIYKWTDTKGTRSPDSKAYALLNDAGQPISPHVTDALSAYQIRPVLWTRRQEVARELAA